MATTGTTSPASISGLNEMRSSLALLRGEHGHSLADERREREGAELPVEASHQRAACFAADDDERSLGCECSPESRETAVPTDVEDQVVAVDAVGEILSCVVDDSVGADGATRSSFAVLHTPVTSAPKALASCTA